MDPRQCKSVTLLSHPLIEHKIALLRDKDTEPILFRKVVEELSLMEAYEAMRELPQMKKEVVTPLETTTQNVIDPSGVVFVPVLRAGLGMLPGFLSLVPGAKVGQIGLRRDEKTLKPIQYLCKIPPLNEKSLVYLLDPMLATGGSALEAIRILKERGARHIVFACLIAAPEGVEAFARENPDVRLYVLALDRGLSENGYIVPGLGDAGDRLFGTEEEVLTY